MLIFSENFRDFNNGVRLSRQTMANWSINSSDCYFAPLVKRMRQEPLRFPVTQSDETPTQVFHDGRAPGSKSYMWVHRSGEFFKDRPIVIYEYQKSRSHGRMNYRMNAEKHAANNKAALIY